MNPNTNELALVTEAVTDIDSSDKKEAQKANEILQDYLALTKLKANLLTGNYEAALRLTTPVFSERRKIASELPHLGIIISLLARLKIARGENRLNVFEYPDASMQELNNLTDALIAKGDISPNGAMSLLSEERNNDKIISLKTSGER